MNNYYIDKATREVKKLLDESPDQSVAHLWPHIEGVLEKQDFLVPKAAKKGIKIDREKLGLATIGHDLIQPYNKDKTEHIANSARGYNLVLKKIGCTAAERKAVLQIMSEHSSEVSKRPSSPEAIILFIADKWDGIGQKGKDRTYAYCKQKGMTEAETDIWYAKKIEKARPMFLELLKELFGNDIPSEIKEDLEYTLNYLEEFKKKQNAKAV